MKITRIVKDGYGGFVIHADDGIHAVANTCDERNFHLRAAKEHVRMGGRLEEPDVPPRLPRPITADMAISLIEKPNRP